VEEPSPRIGRRRTTWKVDRVANGRVVLDRMFKGAGLSRTPNRNDTLRYETWIADASQPLEMQVSDTGTYYGPIPGAGLAVTLDLTRITCPTKTSKARPAQIRSSILQFDYEQGTYTWETPRLITACDESTLRTPKLGSADWMAKAPFDIASDPVPLEFEMVHRLTWPDEWYRVTGPFTKGDTEIVLSRSFDFTWNNPIAKPAPVKGELVLVLRRTER
ncbi:MAG TPA: hypothetical protein VFV33_24800, partial [Gemmatimonadaceae bacterium]|nr:hypothetical protein [Gemmatimonadaceae bacterium]